MGNATTFRHRRYERTAAAAVFLAGGLLVGVPAQAAPTDPAAVQDTSPLIPVTGIPGALPPGLAEALQRDLGISEEQFRAAGELGRRAEQALPRLQETGGYAGMSLLDGEMLISGSGPELMALAEELGARLEPVPEAAGATRTATDLTALTAEYLDAVGAEGLESVGFGGNGFTISVRDPGSPRPALPGSGSPTPPNPTPPNMTPQEFAAAYTNVVVRHSAGAGTALSDKVYGGQGYLSPQGPATENGQYFSSCSVGFNGWSPAGNPAIITAGHCARDGDARDTFLLSRNGGAEPAGRAELTDLGTFGVSRFGGPGNTPVAVGTDVAVIDGINTDLDLLPEATQWEDGELSKTTTRITGTGTAVPGQPVCRSGLATGWQCGTVDELADFAVAGFNYGPDDEDLRMVRGFVSTMGAGPGDSGGPVISGSTALGILSAGFVNELGVIDRVGAADLSSALSVTGGYTLALHLEPPVLEVPDGGDVLAGQVLNGTAPAGTVVRVSVNAETADVPVAAGGTWSLSIPLTVADGGSLDIAATATAGYNRSAAAEYALTVKHAPLGAPVLASPSPGSSVVEDLRSISGTGEPGATVSLAVAPAAAAESTRDLRAAPDPQETTAVVHADGSFSAHLATPLPPGTYVITAAQDGVPGRAPSPESHTPFTVIYLSPVITSLRGGEVFTEASAPSEIFGTGVPGATLTLAVGDQDASTAVDADGNWSVDAGPWQAGEFTVTATQELAGIGSEPAALTVQVVAVQAAAAGTAGEKLPVTGTSPNTLALLAAAGVLLAAGAAGLGLSRLGNRPKQLPAYDSVPPAS